MTAIDVGTPEGRQEAMRLGVIWLDLETVDQMVEDVKAGLYQLEKLPEEWTYYLREQGLEVPSV